MGEHEGGSGNMKINDVNTKAGGVHNLYNFSFFFVTVLKTFHTF